jgi:hypothetical protein
MLPSLSETRGGSFGETAQRVDAVLRFGRRAGQTSLGSAALVAADGKCVPAVCNPCHARVRELLLFFFAAGPGKKGVS